MTKFNKPLVDKLIVAITALMAIDVIMTYYGFYLGIKENNEIVLLFINIFGTIAGMLLSNIVKLGIIAILYIIYINCIYKKINVIEKRTYLYNVLNGIIILSLTIDIIVTFRIILMNAIHILNIILVL